MLIDENVSGCMMYIKRRNLCESVFQKIQESEHVWNGCVGYMGEQSSRQRRWTSVE